MKNIAQVSLAVTLATAAPVWAGVASVNNSTVPGVELIQTGQSSSSLSTGNRAWAGVISESGLLYLAGDSVPPRDVSHTTTVRLLSSGAADTSWASGGAAITPVSKVSDQALACLLDGNGLLVTTGDEVEKAGKSNVTKVSLTRYTANGTLDATFGSSGIVKAAPNSNDSFGKAIGTLSDGSLIVGGYNVGSSDRWMLGKFTPSGALDQSFGNSGWVIQSFPQSAMINAVVIDNDSILVAGQAGQTSANYDLTVARYTSSGQLDPSFNGTGIAYLDLGGWEQTNALAVQSDGKILVGGSNSLFVHDSWMVARFNTDGSLDTTFGGVGYVTLSEVSGQVMGLAVQSDGGIIVAGYGAIGTGIARLNPDGSRDVTYNGGTVNEIAVQKVASPHSVQLQPDGKAVIFGYSTDSSNHNYMMAIRYNLDGSLDTSF